MEGTKAEREARVDALLIEPLAGLKRGKTGDGKRQGEEGHAKMITRLRSWLAYLDDDHLRDLRDHIVFTATRGEWLPEAHIRRAAMVMKAPPKEVSTYPCSMMTSALGDRAMAQGWAFEMYQEVKRYGPPPFEEGGWKEKQLREQATETARRLLVIRENIAAGIASDRDRAALAYWESDMAEIRAMQDEKKKGAGV